MFYMSSMKYTEKNGVKLYNYRWVVIVSMFIVHCILNGVIIIMAGMAANVMQTFELNTQQFSLCNSVPFLAGFILGIPSGTLADRIGIRKVMVYGLAIATLGAIWRIFATDFWTLFLSSFVMGIALASLNANSAKLLRLWFPGRFMSVGMGVYVAGATVGSATALAIGQFVPMIPTFIACAILLALSTIIWAAFVKTHPDGEGSVKEPIVEHLGSVCKSKALWVTCLLMFLIMGLSLTQNGFQVAGMTAPTEAGGLGYDPVFVASMASLNNIFVSIGGIIMPSIAARLNNVKKVFVPSAFCIAVLLAIGWFSKNQYITLVCWLAGGILMGGVIPLAKTMPSLLPDIKPEHLGAAGGLQSTAQNLGAFLVPSFIVTPLAGDNFTNIFIGAIIIAALIGIFGFLYKDHGATPAGASIPEE